MPVSKKSNIMLHKSPYNETPKLFKHHEHQKIVSLEYSQKPLFASLTDLPQLNLSKDRESKLNSKANPFLSFETTKKKSLDIYL